MPAATDNPLPPLFPDDVATVFSPERPAGAALTGIETGLAQKMGDKRLNEFIHGRHCARLALEAFGAKPVAIGKGDSREPLWPTGITGTISHTGAYAAAVVSSSERYAGLGLDMESAEPLEEKLFKAICRPEETALFDPQTAGFEAKLLFSIKEAVYKCLWPSVREFIDFKEIQVELLSHDSFRAIPHTDKYPVELAEKLEGRFLTTTELVISSAWILR